MSLQVDTKSAVTQTLMEQLQKHAGKIAFMPDKAVVDSIRLLEDNGIPNNKQEDYKYCNLEAVIRKEYKTVTNSFALVSSVDSYRLNDCINIAVINGEYNQALSDTTSEVIVSTLQSADKEILSKHLTKYADVNSDTLISLNTAFTNSGLFIHIKSVIKKPIHIINVVSSSEPVIINPRQLIITEANSEATIIESFVSENETTKSFQNHLTEFVVGDNSTIKNYRIQNENTLSTLVNTSQIEVNKYGNYTSNTFSFGGSLVRNNLNVVLASDLCEAHLNGLFVLNGLQQVDNHTLVDHQKPNCQSNELYKGIVKDKSTGTFNGKIFVRKDAQKTNAYQSSKNILMSDDATINTKPQLEIYADDVKCSHGTSTGKIDTEALFYLKARGIGEENARKLLLQAFAQELIDKIEIDSLKEHVSLMFEKAL